MVIRVPVSGYRCLFILALLGVTYLALAPAPELSLALWDKANHSIAFFTLALLGDRSFPQSHLQWLLGRILPALFVYGLLIEVLQFYMPPREASLLDILANTTGLFCYLALRWKVMRP